MKDVPGVIYLIHFDTPLKHAQHYIGWTENLSARLREHASGRGARIMQAVTDNGIRWRVARIWKGTRRKERQLKNRGGASRSCPCCGVRMYAREADMVRAVGAINELIAKEQLDQITEHLPCNI